MFTDNCLGGKPVTCFMMKVRDVFIVFAQCSIEELIVHVTMNHSIEVPTPQKNKPSKNEQALGLLITLGLTLVSRVNQYKP